MTNKRPATGGNHASSSALRQRRCRDRARRHELVVRLLVGPEVATVLTDLRWLSPSLVENKVAVAAAIEALLQELADHHVARDIRPPGPGARWRP